ncbi:VacJ family lipoprotein [Thalassomonas haliotis]|uniref:VacJ family lipoprotein n=1 Tax=Thalassomonas haliotis TaxID=485448 RepID=A0ABY7VHK2_9GAMM|nr:VacJ family lipoprotein [Thalassomonas haliotis]WDE12520.1 VacJ family lipoprotein [Thalassomonas haliotis]
MVLSPERILKCKRALLRLAKPLLTACFPLILGACSTGPSAGGQAEKGPYEIAAENPGPSLVSYQSPDDPLRFINEPIFSFNDKLYRYLLSPLASGYEAVVPAAVDNSISNFFYNLREPLYALNHLLQGNVAQSGNSLSRVLLNSTLGLLGLFDPASRLMDIKRHKTTFGDTLASYGIGHGTYLVLPFLGPSDIRDTGSLSFNYLLHPLNFIKDEDAARQLLLFDGLHSQAPVLSHYPQIMADIENPYEFIRNLYMQNLRRDGQDRRKEIFKTEQQKQTATHAPVE